MSDQNKNMGGSEKCPNCGAWKVFSALVCPICGTAYADAPAPKESAEKKTIKFYKDENYTEPEEPKQTIGDFDPNAAFAKFKQSLNEEGAVKNEADNLDDQEAKAKSEDSAVESKLNGVPESSLSEDSVHSSSGSTSAPENDSVPEKAVIIEETGKKDFSEKSEATYTRPDESLLNSGLYGERRYRFADDLSKAPIMSETRPEPEPDQTIVPTRYGLDSKAVQEKREQSLSEDGRNTKMFSNTVSNRYEQYRADRDNSQMQPVYSTPYNRGNFDAVPEEKPNVLAKILPLAAVLVIVLIVGFFGLKYLNREKNEKGIEYQEGSFKDGYYINDWSEIKFKYDDRMMNAPSALYSTMRSMYSVMPNTDIAVNIHMFGIYNETPAVMVMTFSDGSIFGIDEDEFFDDNQLNSAVLQSQYAPKREPDMTLGSHTYKVISGEMQYENNKTGRMYLAVRKIGNKLNVVILYEIPGKVDINTTKKYFEVY